jgi:arylsulfatase A-like enzyme
MRLDKIRRFAGEAILLVAVIVGWTAYDLVLLAVSGEPYLVLDALPGYAALLCAAAVVGFVCAAGRYVFWALFALTAVAAVAPKLYRFEIAWYLISLPRAILLLLMGFLLVRSLARRSRPVLRPGAGLGVMAAAVFSAYLGPFSWVSACALVVGLVLVLTTMIRRPVVRHAASAATLVVCLGLVAAFAWQNAQLRRGDRPHAPASGRAKQRPNLILIVLDTVSAHHLALYGYSRVTTPGLDDFVRKNAIQYTQARSVSSWTLPSHASIFTGLYPSEHGADHFRSNPREGERAIIPPGGGWPAQPLRGDVPTLAELLAEHGYQTGAIVANAPYLAHEFGVDRGFEHYDDRLGADLPAFLFVQLAGFAVGVGRKGARRAETITDLALDWIDARGRQQPFFLFLNYMDAHSPYLPPPSPYDDTFGDRQPSDPLNPERDIRALQYDRLLRYLDAHVTRFLQTLKARSLLDDAVLIITGDHGEAFGEHGYWGHNRALYEKLIRVPLYVKSAGPARPGTSDRSITSPDLYDVILEQLGLPVAPRQRGTSMVAEWYQSEAITEAEQRKRFPVGPVDRDLLAWLDEGLKWIVSSKGDVEAYDLGGDPGEQHPIELGTDRVEQGRARAEAWWKAHPPILTRERSDSILDPAVMEHLRNLGYVR